MFQQFLYTIITATTRSISQFKNEQQRMTSSGFSPHKGSNNGNKKQLHLPSGAPPRNVGCSWLVAGSNDCEREPRCCCCTLPLSPLSPLSFFLAFSLMLMSLFAYSYSFSPFPSLACSKRNIEIEASKKTDKQIGIHSLAHCSREGLTD